MTRLFLPIILVLSVPACDRAVDDPASPADTPDTAPPVEVTSTYAGAAAYEKACARCHDEGLHGAPKAGAPEDWAGRSWLWEAVLFEHAKQGYNDMPAKGGYEELDDAVVEQAAEHMLRMTHGARPPD